MSMKMRSVQSAPKKGIVPLKKVKKVVTCLTEDQEQVKFVNWLDKNRLLFFAVPNGGYRNAMEGVKFKRCGVKRGVPDVCIAIPSSPYHGLYIELKRVKGGKVSEEQKWWIENLRKNGYRAEIAYGFEEAKNIVKDYLKMYDGNVLAA